MKKKIKDYFSSVSIEYFAILPYSYAREINSRIIERQGFEPKSVIIYLLPYYSGETENLSRYAASLDYHIAISEINGGLEQLLKQAFPEASVKGYGDHSPIDERHAALISGLGISGDNGLIINEKYGSYVFIGDMLTDIEPDILGAIEPTEYKRCEGCGLCKRACPTGILRGEGEDCLSAITQRKGELSDAEKDMMRKYNTLWGCDICQSVCPHNRRPVLTPVEFFYRDRIACLTEDILDNMSEEDFRKRAFAWRKRNTVERNIDILYRNK
ncbi:MAG: epoxyqueuosine reductase [Clostridia bacterium]|nr:epoxyqueuosine reductase [Clostridia bacterium]